MDRKRKRLFGLGIAALAAFTATVASIYYLTQQDTIETERDKKYTRKPITIVLTESVLSSKLPINEILKKTENVVFVCPIEVEIPLDETISYKLIPCDTEGGLWSIVKHLQSDTIFVVRDDLQEDIPQGMERYVGNIVELDQNFTVINESILSFIIS